jgi:rod shape determining protein RodA
MKLKILNLFDYVLLTCVIVLVCMGICFIYSSGINSDGVLVSKEYIKQIIWAFVGLAVMVGLTLFDYRKLYRIAPIFAIIAVLLLVYTRLFGKYVNGAKSWIGIGDLGIQPSEIIKVFYIIFLAWFFDKSKNEDYKIRFAKSLCIMLVPMGLILIQPDLGTASVYLPIFLVMAFMAGIPLRLLMIIVSICLGTILFTVLPVYQSLILHKTIPIISILTNRKLFLIVLAACLLITAIGIAGQIIFGKKYFYWITYVFAILSACLVLSVAAGKVLKPYQIQRLIIFIDPSSDPQGAGWNIIQSETAIGSGNFWGRGFMRGTQSHYRFLPEQSTDFIFSILAEEMGFAGGLFVFALFLVILIRITIIIKQTTNSFGCYISSGILGMLFFHFFVNVGMVMGLMPITGIPLPFLSYGGSALITNMISIGLLMSINSRRLDFSAAV